MHTHFLFNGRNNGGLIFSLALLASIALGHAQEVTPTVTSAGSDATWQRYNWLRPTDITQGETTVISAPAQDISDPFSVLTNGALWQDKSGAVYTRPLGDALSLSYETSAVTLNAGANPLLPQLDANNTDDLSRGQKIGLQFQPAPEFTLKGNVHNSVNDASPAVDSTTTSGAGFWAEGHLPFNSVLTLGADTDSTGTDLAGSTTTHYSAYDAQFQQPLGKIPVTAVFKGHYEATATPGAPAAVMPSSEQSLVWKPAQETTVQMGLRQQHYQNFPGMSSDFNEAVFADWSQKVAGEVTWHSYAEMIDSRSNLALAPGVSTSGANGTPQTSPPGGPSISSAVPLLAEDKSFTFSTGPSFKIEKDVSASVEYSNRWDQNPVPGSTGPEQRLSVSVKGSF